jgi:glyoxylase-like metal-dependent hydrolase (beta-lactamase superfamily II)
MTTPRTQPSRIRCLDTHQYGVPGRGAVYVIAGARSAIVETGTPRAAPMLVDALRDADLAYIFVTHVHLDHAGGAGALAAEHPEATVVAHPQAVRHLADPTRLVDGVRKASPDLFPLYGTPTPIPQDRLLAAGDGEQFGLGAGIEIEVVHGPGHAPHQTCFFERPDRVLFTGDAVGNFGIPFDVPLTVPPGFDRQASRTTLRRLRSLEPERLAFTHFGLSEGDSIGHIDRYEAELDAWFERIARLRRSGSEEHVVREILAASRYDGLGPSDRFSIEMCVRGALLTLAREDS